MPFLLVPRFFHFRGKEFPEEVYGTLTLPLGQTLFDCSRGISGWSKLCDIFFRLGECAGGYGLVIGCWILWGGGVIAAHSWVGASALDRWKAFSISFFMISVSTGLNL